MNARTTATNWTYRTTVAVVWMFMIGAAAVSFWHIVETSQRLGLDWEAFTCPFLIDGLAVLGLIGRSSKFAESTRRAGLRLTLAAGVLSLAANVYAGHNLGQRLYGVLVVAGFIATECYAQRLRPAPAAPKVKDPKRVAAAKRAARTRARNKRAQLAELELAYSGPSAPVSPAP